jgi:2-polyprenyl-6-methoxyphenol hydroxylase-like FAD-dependent oxidoreductase
MRPWPTTNVTLLGDAIHSMTPFRGIGANTALRDAQLLSRQLIAADRGELPLLDAIHDYEAKMLDYGFAAVRTSLRAAGQFVSSGRAGRVMARTMFRTFSAIPPLKRKVFAD